MELLSLLEALPKDLIENWSGGPSISVNYCLGTFSHKGLYRENMEAGEAPECYVWPRKSESDARNVRVRYHYEAANFPLATAQVVFCRTASLRQQYGLQLVFLHHVLTSFCVLIMDHSSGVKEHD